MKLSALVLSLLVLVAVFAHPQERPTITIPLELEEEYAPLEMVLIPAGTFTMGTPLDQEDRWVEEFPPHEVTISQPFFLGKYEFTQQQWQAIIDEDPSRYRGLNRPMETVSWDRVQEFIEELNDRFPEFGTFRLPTEAEWEYACRGGTTTRFYWGDDPDFGLISDYMWYYRNINREGHSAVGLKRPNPYGLHDMAGNVYEMVQDTWERGFERGPQTDPLIEDDERRRVIKGGSYRSNEHRGRASWRYFTFNARRYREYGFRLALTPTPTLVQSLQTDVSQWHLHP